MCSQLYSISYEITEKLPNERPMWKSMMMGEDFIPFLCCYQANFTVSISWNKWNISPTVLLKTAENFVLTFTLLLYNK